MAEQALRIPLSKVVFCVKTSQNWGLKVTFLKSLSKMGSDVGFKIIFHAFSFFVYIGLWPSYEVQVGRGISILNCAWPSSLI